MPNWTKLQHPNQIQEIVERSYITPCIIYKHSTRCSLSSISRYRLESDWDFQDAEVVAYFLDVIADRDLSRMVAEQFNVHHESPQLLLICNGECIYDASHLDITLAELREYFQAPC